MSATASTGSPTLRRSLASRSISQENTGASEDMAARLVSSDLINCILFTSPNLASLQPTPKSQALVLHSSLLPISRSSTNSPRHNSTLQRVRFEDMFPLGIYLVANSAMKDLKKSATALGSNKLGNQVAPKVSPCVTLHVAYPLWSSY
jgi:hypothetical protein